MKRLTITLAAALLATACATSHVSDNASIPPPPATDSRPVTETLHGVAITDNYQWLEDQNAPETRAWIDAQNSYTDKVLGARPEKELFTRRLEALMNTDQIGTPTYRNGRYFYLRRNAGQDLFSIYVRENGVDKLLIDPAPLSRDHTTSVGIYDVSQDGKLLAYSVRNGGADEVEVHFFNVDGGHETGAPLARARYQSVSLTTDKTTAYFARSTPNGPRVFRRSVAGAEETELFGARYTRDKIIYASIDDSGEWLLIHVLHGSAPKKTELYVKSVRDEGRDDSPVRTIVNDMDVRSYAEVAGDKLVIQTNWNAPNERVMVADLADPQPSRWREVVPENKSAAIQGMSLAGGRVFVRYLQDVKPRIVGYDLAGTRKDDISFETLGALNDVSGSWSSPVAFFSFSSFHVPPTIYAYDVATGQRSTFAQTSAPVNANDFTVEQVWYPSKDGTRVPMFVMYKKGLQRDGSHPAFLTGYGGFTSSQLPAFSPRAIAWAEQGGVYALANLRGGAEFGEAWHQAGMLEQKQHTFDDFIAAAEFLIRERYTSSQHVGVGGGSNGGLLVTALETQRPDLVGAVVCRYPLIDMLRYHKFLVGSYWVPEYGNPEDPREFQWVYAYSPYQHVKQGEKYPATLFITGDADTRVAPLHARKMTALMQHANGSNEPILLRYHVSGGHSGGEPLHVQVSNLAEEMGFLWWQLR